MRIAFIGVRRLTAANTKCYAIIARARRRGTMRGRWRFAIRGVESLRRDPLRSSLHDDGLIVKNSGSESDSESRSKSASDAHTYPRN